MNTPQENLKSIYEMKNAIKRAGGTFYQYRPCRLDEFTIYDIDNILHDVVYAQTPLNMNDPFDSQIGFSAEKLFDELIDIVLKAQKLDENTKIVIRLLVKYDLLDQFSDVVKALIELKKQLTSLQRSMHQTNIPYAVFIVKFRKQIYQRLSKAIKMFFTEQSLLAFGLLLEGIAQTEITEEQIKNLLGSKNQFELIKSKIIALRDTVYIPKFEEFLSKINISCFSASGWDNVLMWAHYANSYHGICIEYDFTQFDDFPGFIRAIQYSEQRPTVSLEDFGISAYLKTDNKWDIKHTDFDINKIIDYLCVKSPKWDYEKEWRIICPSDTTASFIEMPKIKSITLGLKMNPLCRKLILDVCKIKDIDCYELTIGNDNFKIDRRKVENTKADFNIDLETEYMNLLGASANKSAGRITEIAAEFSSDESINYQSLAIVNQGAIDAIANMFFMKVCINNVIKNVLEQDPQIDFSDIKTTVADLNGSIIEFQEYYNVLKPIIESIPQNIRLRNKEIRDIEKQLDKIKLLLTRHKETPWVDVLLTN